MVSSKISTDPLTLILIAPSLPSTLAPWLLKFQATPPHPSHDAGPDSSKTINRVSGRPRGQGSLCLFEKAGLVESCGGMGSKGFKAACGDALPAWWRGGVGEVERSGGWLCAESAG